MTSYPKNNYTLFSPTFKIEENKVPLLCWLVVKQMGYGHFEFSQDFVFRCLRDKSRNGHRTLLRPLIQKIWKLNFLQLSKLKKIKCVYLLDWRANGWVMAILGFHEILSSGVSG